MRFIFILITTIICSTAYCQKEKVKDFDSHQFIKKIDSNKVYFKNSNQSSVNKQKAMQLLDSIYNFKSFIDYDSIFIKFEIRYDQCFSDEFHTVYFLKDGSINLKNTISLHGQPISILVDDTSKGNDATKWLHFDNIDKATLIENKSLSTKKAFQLLDSIYNFKSFIDYDTISIQWQMQYMLCTVWEVNYHIYFLKDGLRNLNYHIYLKGDYFNGFDFVEENGQKVEKWMYYENMVSAKIIKENVEMKDAGLHYVFEDLSIEKQIYLKNPNKYIAYFKCGRSDSKSVQGAFQIMFNPKEVYGIEIDSLKMWELTKALLNFNEKNYALKKASEKGNSVFYNLYYKGVQMDRWRPWQFSKTGDQHHGVDVDRYTQGSKWLNISGWLPLLNLNSAKVISKRKATKIAKELYYDFIENARAEYKQDWSAKPVFKANLRIRNVNISEDNIPKYKYIYIYKFEFVQSEKFRRSIDLNANTGEILSNQFAYKHLN